MASESVNGEATLKELKWLQPAEVAASERKSVIELLQGLQLLGTDEDRKTATAETDWDANTAPSIQVIKSGVSAGTKYWAKLVGYGGGTAGAVTLVLGGIVSFVKPLREGLGDALAATMIGSSAVVLAAVSLALAMFIKGDLESRAVATAARCQGRAEVAAEFLRATATASPMADPIPAKLSKPEGFLLALAAMSETAAAKADTNSHGYKAHAIDGLVSLKSGGIAVQLENGDTVPLEDITVFTTR